MAIVAKQYATLEDYYKNKVIPLVAGEINFPACGIEWAVEYLTMGYLIDRENYPALKKLILGRLEWMYETNEPNIMIYHDRIGEMFDYMEDIIK